MWMMCITLLFYALSLRDPRALVIFLFIATAHFSCARFLVREQDGSKDVSENENAYSIKKMPYVYYPLLVLSQCQKFTNSYQQVVMSLKWPKEWFPWRFWRTNVYFEEFALSEGCPISSVINLFRWLTTEACIMIEIYIFRLK